MLSGFCAFNQDAQTHDRCHLEGCSCPRHVGPPADLFDPPIKESRVVYVEPIPPPSLVDAIEVLVLAAEQVGIAAKGLDQLDAETTLRLLHRLRGGIEEARRVDADMVRHAYLKSDHGLVVIDGLPPARVQRGRDRRNWDGRGAAFAYVDSQMIAREGEMPDPTEVVDWVLEVIGVGYCRTTPLKAAGLDPKAFCDDAPGTLSVTFAE